MKYMLYELNYYIITSETFINIHKVNFIHEKFTACPTAFSVVFFL